MKTGRNIQVKIFSENIQLRFIDSCRFMASGLDQLTSNLCRTSEIQCDKCKGNMELIKISDDYITPLGCGRCKTKKTNDLKKGVLKKKLNHASEFWGYDEKFRLMIQKGVYPYEYMDCWKKFEETSLPLKDLFYSRLSMMGTSDEDDEHAHQVWSTMEKERLGCYHDIYLETDVLLLADVFETFQNTSLKLYKLDLAHFNTAPGLAWQALSKTATKYCEREKKA